MDTIKSRDQIIKELLGLEELSPMESGVIHGGVNKKKEGGKCGKQIDPEVDVDSVL